MLRARSRTKPQQLLSPTDLDAGMVAACLLALGSPGQRRRNADASSHGLPSPPALARRAPRLRLVRLDQFVDAHWLLVFWDLSLAQIPKRWRTMVTLE
jgi:hypothetical protein